MKKIETSVAEMHLDEEGILNIKMKKGAYLTLDKIKEYYACTNELIGDKKVLVLVDGTEEYMLTDDAKFFGSTEEATRNRIAIAFVTRSIANKLMFNLYVNFNKPKIPTKMFSSKETASKWLKTFYIFPGERFNKPQRK